MQIDKERLESLYATLMSEDDNINLCYAGKHGIGSRYFYKTIEDGKICEWKEGDQDNEEIGYLSDEEFLDKVKGKELEGEIFLGYHGGSPSEEYIKDWDEYAKRMGVSKLVTLSTKVPEVIAKRFKLFSEDEQAQLRKLVVEYVKKEWVEHAKSLVFQEEV